MRITLADGATTASGAGVTVEGDVVTITAEGTYILTGSLSDGQVIVETDKSEKLQLVLAGVRISNDYTAPLYIKTTDKVFITLADGAENVLTNTGAFIAIDENNIDACIFSKEDITFNGGGSLTVKSEQGHGIVSKDSLVFTGGTYTVAAGDHGLTGKDDISILNGSFTVTAANDGLHAENDDDETLGNILIAGGSLQLTVGDDGMHAGNTLTINDGTVNVAESYEGLEGKVVNINGGEIYVKASDDGLNAAGGNDASGFGGFGGFGGRGGDQFGSEDGAEINVTGGRLTVNAQGDGVDSNGVINVSGGEVYVSGPTDGGNGALDTGSAATVTGGTVIAAGSTGMAVNFDNSSTQCSMLLSFSGSAGETLTVQDGAGNVLASFTPEKSYQCVVVSTPDLKTGETYTVSAGGVSKTVTLSSAIYSEVGGMGMGGPGGMGGMQPGQQGDRQPGNMPRGGPGGFGKR